MSSSGNAWTVASKKGKPASSPKIKKPFVETMPKIEPKRTYEFPRNWCVHSILNGVASLA